MNVLRHGLGAALLAVAAFAGAAERGSFGFAVEVDTEGFFLNPTLRTVKVQKVSSGSPAETAGLKVGDEIVEVAGQVIAGSKAKDLQPLIQKEVGQTLRLKVRHAGGEVAVLSLVAAPPPAAP